MNFKERLLAITDIETTGTDPFVHEILEIGLVLCHPISFEIINTLNIKVKPKNIGNAVPAAIERNGYKESDWVDAVSLDNAMRIYSEMTANAVFYSYNVTFDWNFLSNAFNKTGVENKMDYHRFDVMSMVFCKFNKKMESVTLNTSLKLLNLPEESNPHNALNGAMQAQLILKNIL
jgi:DNA polymerase III alpha subunit (gram-positive type)